MSTTSTFTALDWIAAGLDALWAVVLCAFPFTIGRSFGRMFGEFGSTLPTITRIAMTPWPGLGLGLGVAILAGLAVAPSGPERIGRRRALLVGAFFGGLFAFVGLMYAMYAPIFDLAGGIEVR